MTPLRIAVLIISSATILHAAPDPDLFDGRTPPPPSQSESVSGSPESGGGESGESSGDSGSAGEQSAEARDLESVGGTGTLTPSAKQADSQAGGSGGSGGSTPSSETPGESSGSSDGSASQEPRNFDEFGFGGVGSQEKVEVNRSKESGMPSASSGNNSTPPEANTPPNGAGQKAADGSQPSTGSSTGDYGTNLPSGL